MDNSCAIECFARDVGGAFGQGWPAATFPHRDISESVRSFPGQLLPVGANPGDLAIESWQRSVRDK